jgi:hypothetical protein
MIDVDPSPTPCFGVEALVVRVSDFEFRVEV